jgi:hypothetical protein
MVELVYLDKKYELDDLQTKQKKKLDMIITDANKFSLYNLRYMSTEFGKHSMSLEGN